jgi:hypothetical protein
MMQIKSGIQVGMKRLEKVTMIFALSLALISLASCLHLSGGDSTSSESVNPVTTSPQKELTHIVASIIANPYSYEGQRVTVVGYYRGWDLLGEAGTGPPVTRSDWVIKDASGAIYIGGWVEEGGSGGSGRYLDPTSRDDIDTILLIAGIVRVSDRGQPYIEAERIEIQP